MRIGFYLGSGDSPNAFGRTMYAAHLASALAASDDVYLYAPEGSVPSVVEGSAVTVVETPRIGDRFATLVETVTPFNAQEVATALSTRQPALVEHVDEHVDVLLTFRPFADLLLSNLVAVETVYCVHGVDRRNRWARLRDRFTRTDYVVANSSHTARRVSASFGYEVDEVVYPGVDTDRFRPDVEPALSRDVPVVLFVGRLERTTGIFELLEAFSRLEREAELGVVGGGNVERVESACRDLGIAASVTITGAVPHAELPGYYRAADVFCLPSHDDSFTLTTLEAMACETPVVTTRLEAFETTVSDGVEGFHVRRGDPADLADALGTLLADPALGTAMGRRGRQRSRAFTWEEQAARLATFLSRIVDDPVEESRDVDRQHRPPARIV